MGEDLSTWISKDEVIERTGLDERTIERQAKKKTPRRAYRPIPGRKPLPVFHPDDVEKLLTRTLTPIPLKTKGLPATRKPAAIPAPLFVPISRKLFLTIAEAVAYSGLSDTLLRRSLHAGILAGMRDGGWKIWREDLERFCRDTARPPQQLPGNNGTAAKTLSYSSDGAIPVESD
jgi:hypothetical protein